MYKNRKYKAGVGLNNDNLRNIGESTQLPAISENEVIEAPLLKVSLDCIFLYNVIVLTKE